MPPGAPQTVGFVGLGMMGRALVGRLRHAGLPVVAWNRTAAPLADAELSGAVRAADPKDVGRRADSGIVFTMVTDGPAQREVLFGRTGVAAGLARGGLVVDLSTVAPSDSRRAAERLARRGIRFLDAPVGGSVDAAAEGKLLFYVGGDGEDLARARPWIEHWARGIEHVGPVGTGAALKVVNNALTVGTLALLSEAVATGEASGIDRDRLLDVLGKGGAASAMLDAKKSAFSRREYPTRFKLGLAHKDLRLFEATARSLGIPARVVHAARQTYDVAIADGRANEDFSAVFEAVRRGTAPAPSPPAEPGR
jgi:3-hydroxyisobutyrate dehydrogenase-like beta-hydroxyacid dehydrogenase